LGLISPGLRAHNRGMTDSPVDLPLEGDDARRLTAAQGWLELCNHIEAAAELEEITPANRAHIDVLDLRWHISAMAGKWDTCFDLGEALVKLAPKAPHGWTNLSQALNRLKRTQEAFDFLRPAADLFPCEWAIRYELACYSCKLGHLEEALDWLEKAFELGDAKLVKRMALDDPELEPLWGHIREM
jgi:tetratricopeptide (TPR) repeat protein